jgi:pilus assembly protein FimV
MAVRTRMIAWLGATLLLPELSHALTVGRLDVRSALGEPFRAELIVSDLGNISASQIQASLATENDFSQLGINRSGYAGALNFSVSGDGSRAVVSIRSNQPLNEPYLELVVRIAAGNNVRLQHVTALLDPPHSRTADTPNLALDSSSPATIEPKAHINTNSTNKSKPSNETALVPMLGEPPPLASSPSLAPAMTDTERATSPHYVVRPNDSLWKIASTLQKQRNTSVGHLMTQIRQLNQDAFLKGDPNQLKQGATLVLPKPEKPQISLTQDRTDLEPMRVPPPITRKPTLIAPLITPHLHRGALPRAEMTLVAPTRQGMAQGNSTLTGRNSGVQPLSRDLATRVGSARRKTALLRREITELDAQVTANDQKIAMQNAKLAELEQRLKARKEAKKRLIMTKTPVVALAAAGLLSSLLGIQPAHAAPAQAASSGGSMWMIIVVALIVIGGVIAFVRKGKSKPTPPPQAKPDARPAPSVARPVSRPDDTAAKTPTPAPDVVKPVVVEAVTPAPVPTPAPVVEAAKPAPVVEPPADPIIEAQAFISRERYPQAVGLLNKAIIAEPTRSDLILLLLDVYSRQHDGEGFDEQFARLESLGDTQAIDIARQLRAEMNPAPEAPPSDAPLAFTSSSPAATPEPDTAPAIFEHHDALDFTLEKPITDGESQTLQLDQDDHRAFTLDTADAPTPLATDSLADLEMEFRTSGVRPALDIPAQPTTTDHSLNLDLDRPADKANLDDNQDPVKLDFDIDGSFELADDVPSIKTEQNNNFAAGFDDLDFSLPSDDQLMPVANTAALSIEELDAAHSNAAMENQADHFDALLDQGDMPLADGSLSSQLAAEFPFLAEQDDQQVNLDLARSYADLGELQSARELLDNVLANGNNTQQDDARQLLAKIAS